MYKPLFEIGQYLERNCVGGNYEKGYRFKVKEIRRNFCGKGYQYRDYGGSWHSEHCVKLFANKGYIKEPKYYTVEDVPIGKTYRVITPLNRSSGKYKIHTRKENEYGVKVYYDEYGKGCFSDKRTKFYLIDEKKEEKDRVQKQINVLKSDILRLHDEVRKLEKEVLYEAV